MNNILPYNIYLEFYEKSKSTLDPEDIYNCALYAKNIKRIDLIYKAAILNVNSEDKVKCLILALEIENPESPDDTTDWNRDDALWRAYDAIVIDAWYTSYSPYMVPAYELLLKYNTFPDWAVENIEHNKKFVDKIREKKQSLSQFMKEIDNLELDPRKKYIHFIHINQREFMLTHWLAVQTAKFHNPEMELLIYNDSEPEDNYWWDRVKTLAKVIKITTPYTINNYVIHYPQHVADVIRLYILKVHGGYYFDLDLLSNKPISDLFDPEKVGLPRENDFKLCNCFISSPYPEHPFILKWWEKYMTEFGLHSDSWAGLSTMVPKELSLKFPELVNIIATDLVLPFDFYHRIFFIWDSDISYPNSYTIHLWDTEAIKRNELPKNSEYFFIEKTPLARMFKRYL